jgi:hypothetical protein
MDQIVAVGPDVILPQGVQDHQYDVHRRLLRSTAGRVSREEMLSLTAPGCAEQGHSGRTGSLQEVFAR